MTDASARWWIENGMGKGYATYTYLTMQNKGKNDIHNIKRGQIIVNGPWEFQVADVFYNIQMAIQMLFGHI